MGHVPEKAGSNPISSMTVKRESIIRKKNTHLPNRSQKLLILNNFALV